MLTYPSHPPYVPTAVQTVSASDLSQDPKGLIYEPVWDKDDLMYDEIQPLFPSLGFWKCDRAGIFNAPDTMKSAALYVTAISTSTESDKGLATSMTTLHEAATTLPELGLSSSSNSLLLAQTAISQVTPAGVQTAASADGREGKSSSKADSVNAATTSSNSQGFPAIETPAIEHSPPTKAVTTIQSTVTTLTANPQDSQGLVEPSVEGSSAASKTGVFVVLPAAVVQSTDAGSSHAATTLPEGRNKTPSNARVLIDQSLTALPPIAIVAQTVTANSQNHYVIGDQTLTPGQPMTLGSDAAATRILLQTSSSQTVLAVGSSTSNLTTALTAAASFSVSPIPSISLPPLIVGTQTISANSHEQYIIGAQTLTPGGVITAPGTPVSLASSPTQMVIGTTTEALGWYIISGLGAGPSTSASKTGAAFAGAAPGGSKGSLRLASLLVSLMTLVVWL